MNVVAKTNQVVDLSSIGFGPKYIPYGKTWGKFAGKHGTSAGKDVFFSLIDEIQPYTWVCFAVSPVFLAFAVLFLSPLANLS